MREASGEEHWANVPGRMAVRRAGDNGRARRARQNGAEGGAVRLRAADDGGRGRRAVWRSGVFLRRMCVTMNGPSGLDAHQQAADCQHLFENGIRQRILRATPGLCERLCGRGLIFWSLGAIIPRPGLQRSWRTRCLRCVARVIRARNGRGTGAGRPMATLFPAKFSAHLRRGPAIRRKHVCCSVQVAPFVAPSPLPTRGELADVLQVEVSQSSFKRTELGPSSV